MDKSIYEKFYKYLILSSHCPFENLCKLLPEKISAKMIELGEAEVASWFADAWGGENGTWMNGYLLPGCVLHNNALESTWKWLKTYTVSRGGRKSSLQMFTLGLIRHISEQSRADEAFLEKAGHPDIFPKEPVITKSIWKSVQEISPTALMCMHILQGRPTKFSTFKDAVLQVEEASTLYQKIKGAKTHMTSDDIRRAVFPTARALRDIIHPDSTVEDRARARAVTALEEYKNLALHPEATASGMDIEEILKTLSYFHVVALLDKPWSSFIRYSCSCPEFYKSGACEHSILTSLMVDRSIEVPVQHCTRKPEPVARTTLQSAMVAGSSSESEGDEAEEAPPYMSGRPTMQVTPSPLPPPP